MKAKSGIYKIQNILNSQVYIGSSIDLSRRKNEHFNALRQNNHRNPKLQNTFNKYGEENFVFEVIEEVLVDSLLEREQYYITHFQSHIKGYNISPLAQFPIYNNAIPVIQLSLDNKILGFFDSYKAAARALEIDDGGVSIGCVIRGIQKTAYGYKWIKFSPFLSEEEIITIASSIKVSNSNIQKLHPLTGELISLYEITPLLTELSLDRSTFWKYCKSLHKYKDYYWRRLYDDSTELNLYLGCDVGKNGALSLISQDGKVIWNFQMPKVGSEIDSQRLSTYLSTHVRFIKHCVLEDVHSIFGTSAKANFQFGRSLGILEGVLHSLQIPYTKITPKTWQSTMWEGIKPIENNTGKKTKGGEVKRKIDTKATSLLAVKRLFPLANLTASQRSKKPSDGIVDSLLMAEYCRRKFK